MFGSRRSPTARLYKIQEDARRQANRKPSAEAANWLAVAGNAYNEARQTQLRMGGKAAAIERSADKKLSDRENRRLIRKQRGGK